MYLEYYVIIIATNCDPIHDLSSNFHAKIATQLYKIILDTVVSDYLVMNHHSFATLLLTSL